MSAGNLDQKVYVYAVFPSLILGCRKWGCNKWGLKGCLAALPGNRPKSAFVALFLPFSPFSGGCEEDLGNPENALFPQISSDFLKAPSLKPPFGAFWRIRGLFETVSDTFGPPPSLRG